MAYSDSFLEKLSRAIAEFGSQLGSSRTGTLAQAWVPEPGEDGSMVLKTQGVPFCVSGTGDLLALFRCISCKYKLGTDTTKASLMGAVGRVFVSGEPELTNNLQSYDQSVYVRVAEARRCQINCCMFLPVFETPARDRAAAVLEVAQSEDNALFAALIDWARCCLESGGLYTTDADKDSLPLGLRVMGGEMDLKSALESGVGGRPGSARLAAAGSDAVAASMPPPPRQHPAAQQQQQQQQQAAAADQHRQQQQHCSGSYGYAPPARARVSGPFVLPGLPFVDPEADDAAGGRGGATPPLHAALAAAASSPFGRRQKQHSSAGLPPPPPQAQGEQAAQQGNAIVRVGNILVLSEDAELVNGSWPPNARRGVKRLALESLDQTHSEPPPAARDSSLPAPPLSADTAAAVLSPGIVAQQAAGRQQPAAAASYGHGDRAITFDDLCRHFGLPLKDAAANMGICVTTLKRACRRLGLPRWPHRELKKMMTSDAGAAGISSGSGQTISAGSSGEQPPPQRQQQQLTSTTAPARPVSAGAPQPQMLSHLHFLSAPAASAPATYDPLEMPVGGAHSMESIDILAAGDFDLSVGNSPGSAAFFPGGGPFADLDFPAAAEDHSSLRYYASAPFRSD